jgi:nucleoside-diphosphate-sugar epimerase
MRALVTGASGFLGLELVRQLRVAGDEVIAAVGPEQNELEAGRCRTLEGLARIVKCELRDEQPLAQVPEDWDTLFHLASYVRTEEDSDDVRINDEGTQRLLRQLPLAGKRVLFASTLAVADNAAGGHVRPDTICLPRTAYGRTKLAAEAIVRQECGERGAPHTIVRLPTLYGPGYRPGGMFDVLPKRLLAGDVFVGLMWPGPLALLAVEDAARLIHLAALHEGTRDRTFLASSNENPATWQIVEEIAADLGIRYRKVPLPGASAQLLDRALDPLSQVPGLPHRVRVTAWRAHLLLNGLSCDDTLLAPLLGVTFRAWRSGFARMYAEDTRGARLSSLAPGRPWRGARRE